MSLDGGRDRRYHEGRTIGFDLLIDLAKQSLGQRPGLDQIRIDITAIERLVDVGLDPSFDGPLAFLAILSLLPDTPMDGAPR